MAPRAFAWLAMIWCAAFGLLLIVGGITQEEDQLLYVVVGLIPIPIALLGLIGAYSHALLTWLSMLSLVGYLLAPGLLGLFFLPAALLLLCSLIARALPARVPA